jgi:diguanylate cyclase (GGDEF)-like protein
MNYLKEINDNYGHLLGDLYLSEISNILKKRADGNPVFRLGGDEFAILIRNASEAKLTAMIDAIKDDCKKALIGPKPLSISLGFELKYFGSDMMDDVFALAESKMYMEKNRIKRISGN